MKKAYKLSIKINFKTIKIDNTPINSNENNPIYTKKNIFAFNYKLNINRIFYLESESFERSFLIHRIQIDSDCLKAQKNVHI